MSDNRLDNAIEAMKNEPVDPAGIKDTQTRVRQKLEDGIASACSEFRQEFHDYVQGSLAGNRRLLLEDHLGRCPKCRAHLAAIKGGQRVRTMPERRSSRWPRRTAWAAVAAMVLCAIYLGRGSIDTYLAPGGPVATIDSLDGRIFMVPAGMLKAGDAIGKNETVRTAHGSHARLRLADGSLVDLNESTELALDSAWSGQSIQLKRGDIIVQAAKQRHGSLRVRTRDSLTSVKGTVFAVSSGLSGTLVSVVEGSVAVTYSGEEVLLSPGEQESTNPLIESSVEQAVSWSPDAESYISMLASLSEIQERISELPAPQLPMQSRLLPYMPANTVAYGAIPNLGNNIAEAMAVMEQQATVNPLFSEWWDYGDGQKLKALMDRIQTITPYLGDEIVCGLTVNTSGTPEVPLILAEILPDSRDRLEEAIRSLTDESGAVPFSWYIDDSLLIATAKDEYMNWIIQNLGTGAGSSFAAEIADRYSSGVGWLFGMDVSFYSGLYADMSGFTPEEGRVKYLFFNQRNSGGIAENELTVAFDGQRTGLSSFLADSGTGGAAEYISSEALAAGYIVTREPRQLFEEFLARLSPLEPSALDSLTQAEAAGIGIEFSNNLAQAIGTESAFSIDGISISGLAWTAAVLVNDSVTLEDSIQKLVDACNTAITESGETVHIDLEREIIDGRTWTTIRSDKSPFGITWTYDGGYMIAASDRANALRAIATRNSGFPLIWDASFQQQLPASSGFKPSGFFWLNTKGAFQNFAALIQDSTYRELITQRDPILVVLNAEPEEIRAVSRTRISSAIMDLMLFRELGEAFDEQQN